MGFLVCVHDASPVFSAEIAEILAALAPLTGSSVHLGVVPNWHERFPIAANTPFSRVLRRFEGEVLLHGYSHETHRRGWLPTLTNRASEFSGLGGDEAMLRLAKGRDLVCEAAGRPPVGFIAPAWLMGPVDRRMLSTCGLEYAIGYRTLVGADGRICHVRTRSWDFSPCRCLNRAAILANRVAAGVQRSVPCIVLHPADLRRGFLPNGLHVVRTMIEAGEHPLRAPALLGGRP